MISRNNPTREEVRDHDFAGAEVAMQRAARRARQRANIAATVGEQNNRNVENLSFSQAQGYEEVPETLKLEELNKRARTQIWNLLFSHMEQSTEVGMHNRYISGTWRDILKSTHALYDNRALDDWNERFSAICSNLRNHIENDPFNLVFDRLQFILRVKNCPMQFIRGLKRVFAACGLAYTIDESSPPTIFPVATPEEGMALLESMQILCQAGLAGSSSHLRNAANNINQQDWAGGVRESIHAVESVARKIDPKASRALKPALKSIEIQGALHPALKEAFTSLYGYTSDQQGIRHALLDSPQAKVGADEAVFMLGACASFASYLWRKRVGGGKP